MINKRITGHNIEYWTNKGYTIEESYELIKKFKKENSCWNKEFWIVKKGYTEKDAIEKVKEIQSKNSKKRDRSNDENLYLIDTWIKKGYSEEDSIKKVKELKDKCNIYKNLDKEKLEKIIKDRKNTYYSKSIDERNKINISRGRTKKELIEKFGEDYVIEISKNRGKGKRNNLFKRYSKISKQLFDNLQKNTSKKLLYAENELWIRFNKNNGYYVDLMVENENKIIEFNGDFYHANPLLYETDSIIEMSKSKILKAYEIWKKDEIKINNLKKLGYDILIIWEKDLLTSEKEVIDKCINFIKK